MSNQVLGFGVNQAGDDIQSFVLNRRDLTEYDVLVKILYCGVCHSDKHHIYNDWGDSHFPLIPGHEIIGIVEDVGIKVSKVVIGDRAAIGNMVDSCMHCAKCQKGDEQYCLNGGPTWTYNSRERVTKQGRTLRPEGERTFGGYSTKIVSNEDFVLKLPVNLDLAASAPLLCAGITMFYPLKHFRIGKGHKVGIAGIGGLGHLGIKFAKALNADVVALTTSQWKLADSLQLGADDSLLINEDYKDLLMALDKIDLEKPLTERDQLLLQSNLNKEYRGFFDIIISTIPVSHDVTPYLQLLKPGSGKLHIVGNLNTFPDLKNFNFVFFGKDITSSNVGGIPDTKELLQFCSNNQIVADVQLIKIEQLKEALTMIVNKHVRYRYVLDFTQL